LEKGFYKDRYSRSLSGSATIIGSETLENTSTKGHLEANTVERSQLYNSYEEAVPRFRQAKESHSLWRRDGDFAWYLQGATLLEQGALDKGRYKASENHRQLIELVPKNAGYKRERALFERNRKRLAELLTKMGLKLPTPKLDWYKFVKYLVFI
jgi:hypothetical protein